MSTPEDAAAFKRIIGSDPENKKCFECGYPNPMWCDISHGVFICLNCSGKHRGLGVHLCFVRSATIDDWTTWRPEKLKQMEIGGNNRARLFFERKSVPPAGDCSKVALQARYEHDAALMYADMLEAESEGKPFNEATWRAPEWKARVAAQKLQQGSGGGGGGVSADRFRGVGSAPMNQGGNQGGGGAGEDWYKTISDGWTKVSQNTAVLVDSTSKQLKETHLQEKAQEKASWAWGSVAYYASALGKMATDATTAQNGGEDDDDGLSGLSSNVRSVEKPNDDARYASIEHRSEASSSSAQPQSSSGAATGGGGSWNSWFGGGGNDDEEDNGFAGLKNDLPRGSTYEGVGSSSSPSTTSNVSKPQIPPSSSAASPVQRTATTNASASPSGVRVLKLGEKAGGGGIPRGIPIKKSTAIPVGNNINNSPSPATKTKDLDWDNWGDVEKDDE